MLPHTRFLAPVGVAFLRGRVFYGSICRISSNLGVSSTTFQPYVFKIISASGEK
jgi:hypothetical protein